jgi:sugar/nucleoside kinase (ribokinase family)/fructoselysine-6-P-deglycase FrlB-like protein
VSPEPGRARPAEILVVGDLNPDLVLTGDVVPRFGQAEQLLDDADLVLGGSAGIAAHGLARLGRAVSLVAAVGDDALGRTLVEQLTTAGVDVRHVLVRANVPTGLTVVLSTGEDRGMLTRPGAIASLSATEVLEAATALLADGLRHVHVSSYFLQPRLASALPDLLGRLRELGLTTSLDTNADPDDRWEGVDDLLPHLDVLLPNRAEAMALGRDADPRRAAKALAARGPLTVVKDGAHGAFAVTPDGEVVEEPGSPVVVVDATGAGDTFDAAFVAAWLDDSGLETALHGAVTAGRHSVTRTGGTAGQPTRADLARAPSASRESHVRAEIARQPEAWARATALAGESAHLFPRPGESVAVIGCGTSWFMASAYAALRESRGQGRTDAFAASELPSDRRYDRVVAISRSGTTTEVVRAIETAGAWVLAITAVAGTPVPEAADDAVVLDFADEQSVVQTVFATTTLSLLRASLGESLDRVVEQARQVLAGEPPLPRALADADQISFLGSGWAYGVAQEAALKLREAAQLWTESYLQMEYRHGPIAVAQPGRAVWILGTPAAGLVDDVLATGATLVGDALDPQVDLVRAQLLAVDRAERSGLDPDRPRHLTRSVVLADS